MADHELRPECAKEFGTIHATLNGLRRDADERRDDFRDLRELITDNKDAVLDALGVVSKDVARLQVRARGWGAIGGLFAALVTLGIAAAVAAFSG